MTQLPEAETGLTIRRIQVRAVEVVPERPVETAAGTLSTVPLVLIDLDAGDGLVGCSYLRCYTPLALRATARLVSDAAETVVGSALIPDRLGDDLRARFRLLGLQGIAAMTIAGLEMATWDALAKARRLALVELLGGERRPVTAYASLRSMRPAAAAAEAAEALTRGFSGVKLKLGLGSLSDDLAAIRAVRDAIGERTELMVDYNQSLSVAAALERVRVLDGEGLTWIEEPTRAEDYRGHATIAAAARTPIQLGENWWGPEEMAKSIAAGASDHVTLDAMKLGGEWDEEQVARWLVS